MIYEIHGAGFSNKGAHLMLMTTVRKLSTLLPDTCFALDPAYASFTQRASLGLNLLTPSRGHVGSANYSALLLRQRLFAALRISGLINYSSGLTKLHTGCVDLNNVCGLIDISGFAFTEQWGVRPTQDFAALTSFYKKKGLPVVLMPQAFGPFHNPEIRTYFAEVVKNSDLIYARDDQSYKNVMAFPGSDSKVHLAPDITLFYDEQKSLKIETGEPYVCLVPNERMYDQGAKEWRHSYNDVMEEIGKMIRKHDVPLKIVVHDCGSGDREIAIKLAKVFRNQDCSQVELIEEEDPLLLKHILGNSLFVISSRYHALVSALSQAVPVIALGWSHKYQGLMKDFGLDEQYINASFSKDELEGVIGRLFDPDRNSDLRNIIARSLYEMQKDNAAMWGAIIHLLRSKE